MLQALGFKFYNAQKRQISEGIKELDQIAEIDCSQAMAELEDCTFRIACDVKNPLYGKNGGRLCLWPAKRGKRV